MGLMELTIRDWMVIVAVLLLLAVGIDAWRRVQRDRRSRVKMKLARTPGEANERDVDIAWLKELPNGGARVVSTLGGIQAACATHRRMWVLVNREKFRSRGANIRWEYPGARPVPRSLA